MLRYYWWRVVLFLGQKSGKLVKEIFEIGSPYTSFSIGVSYSYINQVMTYQETKQYMFLGARIPRMDELNKLNYEIQTILMNTSLFVWAMKGDRPVVALIIRNKKIKTIPMRSFYKANILCISPLYK